MGANGKPAGLEQGASMNDIKDASGSATIIMLSIVRKRQSEAGAGSRHETFF